MAFLDPISELSKRPDDKRVMLEMAALFMSNWGFDHNAENGSGDGHSKIVSDDKGGICFDQDGNIIKPFCTEGSPNDVFGGYGWQTKGRRDWGEGAVFWFDRAVRKETQSTPLWMLRERASNEDWKFVAQALLVGLATPERDMLCFSRFGFVPGRYLYRAARCIFFTVPAILPSHSNIEYGKHTTEEFTVARVGTIP